MINFPDKPWEDGQRFTYTNKDDELIVATYDASKNAWTFTRIMPGSGGGGGDGDGDG